MVRNWSNLIYLFIDDVTVVGMAQILLIAATMCGEINDWCLRKNIYVKFWWWRPEWDEMAKWVACLFCLSGSSLGLLFTFSYTHIIV